MPLIRVRFEKKGRLKYISHLDLIRTMQRAIRRADISIEYSKGFNPHQKISFGPALAVGTSSSSEYMDLNLTYVIPERNFIQRLNDSLIQDISITEAMYIPDNSPSLTSVINAAMYSIQADYQPQGGEWEEKIFNFFSSAHVYVEKTNKKGIKNKIDIIPLVLEIKEIKAACGRLALELVLATGSDRNLKPIDLLEALQTKTEVRLDEIKIHRKELLIIRDSNHYTPFEIIV